MKRSPIFRLWLLLALTAIAWPSLAVAAEPAREFLDELRDKHYFDVALDYLDRMQDSQLVPAEFKESLLYERGVTMIQASRFQKDFSLREKQLDEAQGVLRDFLAKQPKHPMVNSANSQLGNLLVERARMRVEKTKAKTPVTAAQKATLLKEARGMYDDALKLFAAMETDLKAKLEQIPKTLDPKKDAAIIERRDQLRADYLQTQLLAAAVKEEIADTEQKGTKPYNDMLLSAAKDYNDIYEKYRTRLAGLYARMYQGRCYVKMNNHKEALSYFADLLDQPDQPEAFRTLKVKTLVLAVECWFGSSPKKYDEAIKKIGPFLDTARPDEARDEEFLSLRLWLAKAHKSLGEDLLAREPGKKAEANKSLSEAKKLTSFVSKHASEKEMQEEAKQLLLKLRGVDEAGPTDKPEPKTFAEAKDAGKDALEAMQVATFNLTELPKQIAKESDPKAKAELESQLAESKKDVEVRRDEAMKYYQLALRLTDRDTSAEEINVIYYFLCFLHYNLGNYYESALLGEFIARKYPDSSGARQCAKIAMAAYLKIYKETQGEDKSFETQRIIDIAGHIVKTWPAEPEAVEAINTLIPFMIREGKLDEAERYLTKIPEDAAPRAGAELKIGQSLWSAYLKGMQDIRRREHEGLATEAELQPEKVKLDDVKKRAQKTLVDGVARMQKSGELSTTVATAVLSLAQIYVDTNQAEAAVKLLEDEKIGTLALVQRKDPNVDKEGLPEETLKTSLRAYISSLATTKDSDAAVKKAEKMMDALKDTTGGTPEGQKKLVSIYVSLARDLQAQMDIAAPEVKKSLSKGFETFLKRVGAGSTEMNILNWVAETFYGIATSFGSDKGGLSAEAKKYYDEADTAFSKMLKMSDSDKNFLTPQMKIQIQHRLAMTKRAQGDDKSFKAAVEMFESILKEHNTMLNVQVEAARTYQEWGAKGKDAKSRAELYARAMMGAKPNDKTKENVIWGWGQIAKKAAPSAEYRDAFFEARYNLALCRFRQAEQYKKDEKEKYESTMRLAKQDIRLTRSLYPDLGEEKWEPQFNELLKKIQPALGEKPVGLVAMKEADPPPAAPSPPKVAVAKTPDTSSAAQGESASPPPDKPAEPASQTPLLIASAVAALGMAGLVAFLVLRKPKRSIRSLPAQADIFPSS